MFLTYFNSKVLSTIAAVFFLPKISHFLIIINIFFYSVHTSALTRLVCLGKQKCIILSINAGDPMQMEQIDIFLELMYGSLKQEISDNAFARMVFHLN